MLIFTYRLDPSRPTEENQQLGISKPPSLRPEIEQI